MPETEQPLPGKRINIVGTTGSGKTTLARRLSEVLGCPHIELDALAFGPNWSETPGDEFRARIADFAAGERWVACGNYTRGRDVLWARADTVVWLDYPFPLTFFRVFRRTMRRSVTRERLWHGNQERLYVQLFTRESLLLWAIKTYRHNRRKFSKLFAAEEHRALTKIRLRSPAETERWLSQVACVQELN